MTLQNTNSLIFWPDKVFGGSTSLTAWVTVADAGHGYAIVFMAAESGNIAKIGFRTGTVTKGGDIDVRVETVAADGTPSGTLWAANTNIIQTVGDADHDTWFTPDLTSAGSAAAVTKGDVVAIVVKADAGFGGSLVFNRAYSPLHLDYNTGGKFPYSLLNTGAWAKNNFFPPLRIVYDVGGVDTYYHVPGLILPEVCSEIYFNSADVIDEIGIKFQVPFPCRVTGYWFWADIDEDVTVKLYGPTTITQTVDEHHRSLTTKSQMTGFFSSTVHLAINTDYRLTLVPGASDIRLPYFNVSDAAMLDALPGNQSIHWTAQDIDNPGFSETTTKRPMMGLLIDQLDNGARRSAVQLFGR